MATVHNPLDDILCILRNEETGLAARIVNSRVRPGTYAIVYRDEQAGETIASRHGLTYCTCIRLANEFLN